MSVNADLLRRTLAHIEQHPAEWDQGDWRCDTGMCFAGTAVTLAGGRWAFPADSWLSSRLKAEPADYETPDVEIENLSDEESDIEIPVVRASERAQHILGLTFNQRWNLFQGGNTLDDLRRIVGELCDGVA